MGAFHNVTLCEAEERREERASVSRRKVSEGKAAGASDVVTIKRPPGREIVGKKKRLMNSARPP